MLSNVRCVAVGYTQNPTTQFRRSLVATREHGVWKLGSIPTRGTASNSLWNVSCPRSNRCVAVGLLRRTSTPATTRR